MTRGKCSSCKLVFSKAAMTRHLRTCREKHGAKPLRGHRTDRPASIFHATAEGRYAPEYWMHFEVPASARLADVDRFLRETWLECCGHLSAFTMRGKEYLSDLGDDDYDDEDVEDMSAAFGAVLERGSRFHHLYDFGTATELSLKVVSCREASGRSRRIKLLARNEPPSILCEVCGNAGVWVCPPCLEGAAGWFCDQCAGGHKCATEIDLLPVVNSPRVGMCGYTGEIET